MNDLSDAPDSRRMEDRGVTTGVVWPVRVVKVVDGVKRVGSVWISVRELADDRDKLGGLLFEWRLLVESLRDAVWNTDWGRPQMMSRCNTIQVHANVCSPLFPALSDDAGTMVGSGTGSCSPTASTVGSLQRPGVVRAGYLEEQRRIRSQHGGDPASWNSTLWSVGSGSFARAFQAATAAGWASPSPSGSAARLTTATMRAMSMPRSRKLQRPATPRSATVSPSQQTALREMLGA